eukprot:m.242575 g.242575  ORF g.242575 m.242575 type:complete len:63 (-) comp16096_c0_seq13:4062-4250(-)
MAHATCGYPITDKDDQQACAFCKQLDTLQKETRVNVEIEIDDGSLVSELIEVGSMYPKYMNK